VVPEARKNREREGWGKAGQWILSYVDGSKSSAVLLHSRRTIDNNYVRYTLKI
jgi:hypothetical protein